MKAPDLESSEGFSSGFVTDEEDGVSCLGEVNLAEKDFEIDAVLEVGEFH